MTKGVWVGKWVRVGGIRDRAKESVPDSDVHKLARRSLHWNIRSFFGIGLGYMGRISRRILHLMLGVTLRERDERDSWKRVGTQTK